MWSSHVVRVRLQVVAATNRIDILDPALLRSGRLDRKIEFPHPTEEARARILQIHSRKMNVHENVNYEELARCTDDFNGAQLKVTPRCLAHPCRCRMRLVCACLVCACSAHDNSTFTSLDMIPLHFVL